ncbi:DUF3427 domain-containing protein [Butyrivibrio sp. MB2005]|uniref:DUF3427 domain-containing protein n=1 Tax=Butyrivibrio sp. MB2005 TaxID=1280678 RepID=UPI00040B4F44|nr:DUF3427 domain-containing protein [Butyrivibrio sp. MB2005]
MAKKLQLYSAYSRQDVHDIFEPNTKFTPQAGSWGLHGIVGLKDNPGDYVLFVTIGKKVAGHDFVEEVFDDGSFTWQSQPSNGFDHKYIKALTNHNPDMNDVYLFLRAKDSDPYTYLGTLEYVTHDTDKEKPVYFIWHMIDFELTNMMYALPDLVIKTKAGHVISKEEGLAEPEVVIGRLTLDKTPANRVKPHGVKNRDFTGKNVDFQGEAKKNSTKGRVGEDAVVAYEKEQLKQAGRADLASQVVATRDTIGETAKYDIQSYEVDGTLKYIEVKTTSGSKNNRFHISEGEVRFSENNPDHYYLYRLYNFDLKTGNGSFYIEKGPIDRNELTATNYMM